MHASQHGGRQAAGAAQASRGCWNESKVCWKCSVVGVGPGGHVGDGKGQGCRMEKGKGAGPPSSLMENQRLGVEQAILVRFCVREALGKRGAGLGPSAGKRATRGWSAAAPPEG